MPEVKVIRISKMKRKVLVRPCVFMTQAELLEKEALTAEKFVSLAGPRRVLEFNGKKLYCVSKPLWNYNMKKAEVVSITYEELSSYETCGLQPAALP